MRIVHLDTERTWRGGERQAFWLARELKRRGHDSRMACRAGSPLEAESRKAGLATVALNPLAEADVFAAWRLRGVLAEARADVLHAHTGHAVGLGAVASALSGVPLVATRRVDFPVRGNVFSAWKYGRCRRVAAISGKVREMLLRAGLPAEKVPVVPSGIDPEGYPSAADRERLRREKGLSASEKLIVNVAALAPHKDQATLLEAAPEVLRRVPDARFLIIGDGELRAELEAKGRAASGRVSFLGHRADALQYVALADVFVMSSKEEGLGTAILDALAVGVPTVATRAGGIPDIYGSPEAPELVPPGDPAALAEALARVLTDPQEALRRVERGRGLVERFTVSGMTDAYEKIYKDVLNA